MINGVRTNIANCDEHTYDVTSLSYRDITLWYLSGSRVDHG